MFVYYLHKRRFGVVYRSGDNGRLEGVEVVKLLCVCMYVCLYVCMYVCMNLCK